MQMDHFENFRRNSNFPHPYQREENFLSQRPSYSIQSNFLPPNQRPIYSTNTPRPTFQSQFQRQNVQPQFQTSTLQKKFLHLQKPSHSSQRNFPQQARRPNFQHSLQKLNYPQKRSSLLRPNNFRNCPDQNISVIKQKLKFQETTYLNAEPETCFFDSHYDSPNNFDSYNYEYPEEYCNSRDYPSYNKEFYSKETFPNNSNFQQQGDYFNKHSYSDKFYNNHHTACDIPRNNYDINYNFQPKQYKTIHESSNEFSSSFIQQQCEHFSSENPKEQNPKQNENLRRPSDLFTKTYQMNPKNVYYINDLSNRFKLMVDSGSNITVFKAHMFDNPPTTHREILISQHTTGERTNILDVTFIKFGPTDFHKVYISDLDVPFDGILGQDFLQHYEAIIDLKNKQLVLNFRTIPLHKFLNDNSIETTEQILLKSNPLKPDYQEKIPKLYSDNFPNHNPEKVEQNFLKQNLLNDSPVKSDLSNQIQNQDPNNFIRIEPRIEKLSEFISTLVENKIRMSYKNEKVNSNKNLNFSENPCNMATNSNITLKHVSPERVILKSFENHPPTSLNKNDFVQINGDQSVLDITSVEKFNKVETEPQIKNISELKRSPVDTKIDIPNSIVKSERIRKSFAITNNSNIISKVINAENDIIRPLENELLKPTRKDNVENNFNNNCQPINTNKLILKKPRLKRLRQEQKEPEVDIPMKRYKIDELETPVPTVVCDEQKENDTHDSMPSGPIAKYSSDQLPERLYNNRSIRNKPSIYEPILGQFSGRPPEKIYKNHPHGSMPYPLIFGHPPGRPPDKFMVEKTYPLKYIRDYNKIISSYKSLQND